MAVEDTRAAEAVTTSGEQPIRAAEVVGALSLATDLGTGQPLEHALRTAVLAVRLGELAGASAQELADTYYVALLHASGCTSNGHEAAQLFGDDIAHRAAFFLIDTTQPGGGARVLPGPRRGRPRARGSRRDDRGRHRQRRRPRARDAFATMCEVAQRFAGWLDLGSSIQAALEYVFARWDGQGFPDARGDEIPLPMRLLHVARDISLFLTAGGADEARAVVERRAGAAYEPRLAELAARNFDDLLAELDETRMWEQALETEPFPKIWIAGERVDAAFRAIAALTGLKSPWLREHSTGVAELAEAAAWRMGLPADDPSRSCDAPRSRTTSAASACRTRSGRSRGRSDSASGSACGSIPTSRSARSPSRRRSRRSGSSPARTTNGSTAPATTAARAGRTLDQPARILAAADCYGAMREARPYRPALDAPAAEAELLREAEAGRLDADAVDAVLAAAGHRVPKRPRELPAGLTERELEVLLVLVRGESNQEIADDLGISAKTVGHHVQHVYEKAGVRSRAAATLWAFEHDLVRTRDRAFARCRPGVRGRTLASPSASSWRRREPRRRTTMILATTTVEDFDRFVKIFSTKGAEKRKQHGRRARASSAIPNEADRVWAIFDWDAEGWQSFASDPEVPGIMQEAGHKGRPQVLELGGRYDA